MEFGLIFLGILLFATSVFMMLLILVQRGKGGGLTGALGGMGGQSAFGSKAGDVFTRITVITAIIWITLCMLTIAIYNPPPRDASTKKDVPMTMSSTDDKESDENADDSSSEANGDAAGDEITPEDVDEELSGLITDDENAESSDIEKDASADSTDESDDGPSLEGNDEDGAEADSEEENN